MSFIIYVVVSYSIGIPPNELVYAIVHAGFPATVVGLSFKYFRVRSLLQQIKKGYRTEYVFDDYFPCRKAMVVIDNMLTTG